jgi:hypothetical protein
MRDGLKETTPLDKYCRAHGYWVRQLPFNGMWYTAHYIHGAISGYSEEYMGDILVKKEYYAR